MIQYYVLPFGQTNILSFEVILDFADNSIIYQYESASGGWHTVDDAVVGLENLDGTGGVSFSTNLLSNESAFAFTMMQQNGGIDVTVLECDENGEGLEGVSVYVDGAWSGETDASGELSIPAGVGTHSLQFELDGYYGTTVEDVAVDLNQVTDATAILSYPEGTPSSTSIEIALDVLGGDSTATYTLDLDNTGYAPLSWASALEILETPFEGGATLEDFSFTPESFFAHARQGTIRLGGASRESIHGELGPVQPVSELDDVWDPWNGGLTWAVEDASVGAVVTATNVYTCLWSSPYTYFVYDIEGNLEFSQPFPGPMQGVRDLAWDGQYLYGAVSGQGVVYRWLPDDLDNNELVLDNGGSRGRGIAIDPETEDIYLSDWGSNLGVYRMVNHGDGTYSRESITLPANVESVYGIAWMPGEPNGRYLWCFCQLDPDGNGDSNGTVIAVDPRTGPGMMDTKSTTTPRASPAESISGTATIPATTRWQPTCRVHRSTSGKGTMFHPTGSS